MFQKRGAKVVLLKPEKQPTQTPNLLTKDEILANIRRQGKNEARNRILFFEK